MIIIESEMSVSNDRVAQVESRYGFRFPPDYRAFVLQHNGGHPIPAAFTFRYPDGSIGGSQVAWFFAIYDGDAENLENNIDMYKVRNCRIPERLIPVAGDDFGNLICLSVSGADYGRVYFWNHERELHDSAEDESTVEHENVYVIANSFDEFLRSLHKVRRD